MYNFGGYFCFFGEIESFGMKKVFWQKKCLGWYNARKAENHEGLYARQDIK